MLQRSNFNPSFNAQLVRDFEAMAHNLKAKSWQVADAREPEEFFGTEASGTGKLIELYLALAFSCSRENHSSPHTSLA